jgi:hypothetical protein
LLLSTIVGRLSETGYSRLHSQKGGAVLRLPPSDESLRVGSLPFGGELMNKAVHATHHCPYATGLSPDVVRKSSDL